MHRPAGLCFVLALLLVPSGTVAGVSTADPPQPAAEAVIIDYTCTDISQIPDYWIEQAEALAIHYAHTSLGSQIVSGIQKALRSYDGNPPEIYMEPDDYWETQSGRDRTWAVADAGLFGQSMWSFCGQQSWYPTDTVQLYLDTLAGFELEYPTMRFILMTGQTDGGGEVLARNNDLEHGLAIASACPW